MGWALFDLLKWWCRGKKDLVEDQIIKIAEELKNKKSFRSASSSEAELLSNLTIRSKAHWGFDEDFLNKCRPHLQITKEYIDNWRVVLMEDSGSIVGYFSLKTINGENRLDNLWIEPKFIRKGYGSLL